MRLLTSLIFCACAAFAQLNPSITSGEQFTWKGDTNIYSGWMKQDASYCASGPFTGGSCIIGTCNDGSCNAASLLYSIGITELTAYDSSNIANTTVNLIAHYGASNTTGCMSLANNGPYSGGIWVVGTMTYLMVNCQNRNVAYQGTSFAVIVSPDKFQHSCHWGHYQAHSGGAGCDVSNWQAGIDFPQVSADFQAPAGSATDYSHKFAGGLTPLLMPCASQQGSSCGSIPGAPSGYMFFFTRDGARTSQYVARIPIPASGNPTAGGSDDPMVLSNFSVNNSGTWDSTIANATPYTINYGTQSGFNPLYFTPYSAMWSPELQQIVFMAGVSGTLSVATGVSVTGPFDLHSVSGTYSCNFPNLIPALYRTSGTSLLGTVACNDNANYSLSFYEMSLGTTLASGATCPSGYLYHKTLTVSSSQVTGRLSDFPLLVNGADNDLRTAGNSGFATSSLGYDIVFTDGHSPLSFELVGHAANSTYSASTGNGEWWVKVPNIAVGTAVYVCFGNSGVSTYQGNDALTWNTNLYRLVAHFNDGSTLDLTESTGQDTFTNHSATATTGKVDGGVATTFAGTQYVSAANTTPLQNTNKFTWSGWLKLTSHTGGTNLFFGKGTQASRTYDMRVEASGLVGFVYTTSSNNYVVKSSTGTLATGSWYLVHIVYDASTVKFYINGALDSSVASASTAETVSTQVEIGRGVAASTDTWNGSLDEFRLQGLIYRPAEWIAAEYNNQSAPSSFFARGLTLSSRRKIIVTR